MAYSAIIKNHGSSVPIIQVFQSFLAYGFDFVMEYSNVISNNPVNSMVFSMAHLNAMFINCVFNNNKYYLFSTNAQLNVISSYIQHSTAFLSNGVEITTNDVVISSINTNTLPIHTFSTFICHNDIIINQNYGEVCQTPFPSPTFFQCSPNAGSLSSIVSTVFTLAIWNSML